MTKNFENATILKMCQNVLYNFWKYDQKFCKFVKYQNF
jgi:hypothetical protein